MGAQADTKGLKPADPLGRSGTGAALNNGQQGGGGVVTAQHTIRKDLPSTYAVFTAASEIEAKDLDPNFNTFDDIIMGDTIRIASILDQLDNLPPEDALKACTPHPETGEPGPHIDMEALSRIVDNGGKCLDPFRQLITNVDRLRRPYFPAWDHFLALSRSLVDLTAELHELHALKKALDELPQTDRSSEERARLRWRLDQNEAEAAHTLTRFHVSKDHVIKCTKDLVQEKKRALPGVNSLFNTVKAALNKRDANHPLPENVAASQRPTPLTAPPQVPNRKRPLDGNGDTAEFARSKKQRVTSASVIAWI
jgi:hypothetical protein